MTLPCGHFDWLKVPLCSHYGHSLIIMSVQLSGPKRTLRKYTNAIDNSGPMHCTPTDGSTNRRRWLDPVVACCSAPQCDARLCSSRLCCYKFQVKIQNAKIHNTHDNSVFWSNMLARTRMSHVDHSCQATSRILFFPDLIIRHIIRCSCRPSWWETHVDCTSNTT